MIMTFLCMQSTFGKGDKHWWPYQISEKNGPIWRVASFDVCFLSLICLVCFLFALPLESHARKEITMLAQRKVHVS